MRDVFTNQADILCDYQPTLKFEGNWFILKKSKVTLTSEIFMEI